MNLPAAARTPFRLILLTVLGLLASSPAATAQDDEPSLLATAKASYQLKLESLRHSHAQENTIALSNKYCTLLTDCASAARAEGKLSEYLAAQKELERFQSSGRIEEQDINGQHPRIARTQRSAMKAMAADQDKLRLAETDLANSYLQHLERLKANLTRQNQIDLALEVDREINAFRLAQGAGAPAAPQPAEHTPPAPARPADPAPASPPLGAQSVPDDHLVVVASDENGPAAGVEIVLRSHTFNKTFRAKTDRKGRADFAILPELDYCILVLDARYEPFILEHCGGGAAYPAGLTTREDGFQAVETGIAGDVQLPGLSVIRITGSYAGGSGSGILLQTSSPRTEFEGLSTEQDRIRLNYDTLTTVTERSRRIELKVLSPVPEIRLFLYRELPPDPTQAASSRNNSRLLVEARSGGYPVQGVIVELLPAVGGKPISAKTDRSGKAEITVDPSPEYTLLVTDRRYVPVIQPNRVGGEACTLDLQPMVDGMGMLTADNGGEFKLPGISPIRFYGFSHAPGKVLSVGMKPSSPKTIFEGHPPATERLDLGIDTWMKVSEGSKSLEFMVLAPDQTRRIIVYRKPL